VLQCELKRICILESDVDTKGMVIVRLPCDILINLPIELSHVLLHGLLMLLRVDVLRPSLQQLEQFAILLELKRNTCDFVITLSLVNQRVAHLIFT